MAILIFLSSNGVLYGYKIIDKKYVIDDEEAKIIKSIFIDASRGVTYPTISNELNEKGITHKGHKFDAAFIHRLIHNRKYIGIVETHGEVFKNIVPPIIDEYIFNKAWNVSASNHKRGAHYKAKKEYLLSGKLYCGYCGEKVTVDGGKNPKGNVFNYYKCSTIKVKRQKCELHTFKKEQLEKMVVDKIKGTFLENVNLEKMAEYICQSYNSTITEDTSLKLNEKALAKNKRETENIVNAIASGILNDALKNRLDELQEEKSKLEIENIKLNARNKTKLSFNDALNFLKTMREMNNETTAYNKRMKQRFIEKIVLFNDRMELYIIPISNTNDYIDEEIKSETEKDIYDESISIKNGLLVLKYLI